MKKLKQQKSINLLKTLTSNRNNRRHKKVKKCLRNKNKFKESHKTKNKIQIQINLKTKRIKPTGLKNSGNATMKANFPRMKIKSHKTWKDFFKIMKNFQCTSKNSNKWKNKNKNKSKRNKMKKNKKFRDQSQCQNNLLKMKSRTVHKICKNSCKISRKILLALSELFWSFLPSLS